jgi:hypothetical protein
MLHHVPLIALQDRLFVEAFRVVRPGGVFVASDRIVSPELAALHQGDIYNPVEPGWPQRASSTWLFVPTPSAGPRMPGGRVARRLHGTWGPMS